MTTLKASLIASAIGMGAWISGLTSVMWPAHPQWAGFFLTLGSTIVIAALWPKPSRWLPGTTKENGDGTG